jgi:hypothetical protein
MSDMPTKADPKITVRLEAGQMAAVLLLQKRWGMRSASEAVRECVERVLRQEVGGDPRPIATATADVSVESVTMPARAVAARPSRATATARTLLEVTKAEIAAELDLPVTAPVVGTKALARIRRAGDDPGRAV